MTRDGEARLIKLIADLKMCHCSENAQDINVSVALENIVDALSVKQRRLIVIRLDGDSTIGSSIPFEGNTGTGSIGTVGRSYYLNQPFYSMKVNFLKGTEEDSVVEINQVAYISGSNCEYENYRNELPRWPVIPYGIYNMDGTDKYLFQALAGAKVEILIVI